MTKTEQRAETEALAKAISATAVEIVRLEVQIKGMLEANRRRGLELAKRVQAGN